MDSQWINQGRPYVFFYVILLCIFIFLVLLVILRNLVKHYGGEEGNRLHFMSSVLRVSE